MTNRNTCPICGQPATVAHNPFCSRRCTDRDLINWLSDGYRLPGASIDPDDAEGAQSGLDSSKGDD